MNRKAYIKGISYYLPETLLTNEDLIKEFPEWTVEKIANKVGINQRHVAAANETAGDMAETAARKVFEEYNINPNSIDFVILCTQSPDYYLPTTACLLQSKLGIPTSAGAFDFNLGCSGYIYGLAIAKGLVFGGIAKNILLLTAETYTKYIHPRDKGNRTIFGDGASATIISTEGWGEIMNFDMGTNGLGANNLIVETGGGRSPRSENRLPLDECEKFKSENHLFMDGSEIFNFTIDIVPHLITSVLDKNQLKKENIDLYVFHQANQFMLEFLRKKLKIEKDKFFYFMNNTGNTVSSTIPIALKEAMIQDKVKGNIVLAGFGVGYSWGGVVLKYD